MSRDPVVAHVDAPLREAAHRMQMADVGAIFVVDGDELVGVVTDRDLVTRAVASDAAPPRVSIGDVMTRRVISCREDVPLAAAAETMAHHQVRRLAVVDRDGELAGVVALADLARAAGERDITAAAALRALSRRPEGGKEPTREDPTGGRARGSEAGVLHVYGERPRLRRARL